MVLRVAYMFSICHSSLHCLWRTSWAFNAAPSAAGLRQLSTLASLRQLDVSGCMNVDAYRALYLLRVRPSASSMRIHPYKCCWLRAAIK